LQTLFLGEFSSWFAAAKPVGRCGRIGRHKGQVETSRAGQKDGQDLLLQDPGKFAKFVMQKQHANYTNKSWEIFI